MLSLIASLMFLFLRWLNAVTFRLTGPHLSILLNLMCTGMCNEVVIEHV